MVLVGVGSGGGDDDYGGRNGWGVCDCQCLLINGG